ncbi:MAG: NFACT RNA binding domain-containing protein [Ignavibacteria bacterium]
MNNFFTIKHTADFLNKDITGLEISEIFSQEKDKLCIVINNNSEEKIIEFSADKKYPYLISRSNFSKARKNSVNLFHEIYGSKISGIDLYKSDRVILFSMSDGHFILFTFFTNKSNCFLLSDQKILNAFKDKEVHTGKDISDAVPEYNSGKLSPPETISDFLKTNYRNFGKTYINEALHRTSLKKSTAADNDSINKIKNIFQTIQNELSSPVFYLFQKDEEFILSLIKLEQLPEYNSQVYPNINELLSAYIKQSSFSKKFSDAKDNRLSEMDKKITHHVKKLDGLKVNLEHSKKSETLMQYGNLILQNIYRINRGDTLLLADPIDGTSEKIEIKLKAELSPSENAEAYFDRYKKLKNSRSLLLNKISSLEKEIIILQSEYKTIEDSEDIKKIIKENKKLTESKNDETNKFRKFVLNEKYQVWVGKDSISNDLLTTKYASTNDLWFHVRGASGSHTVLKISAKEPVPKEIISTAASISAYYSKARNAGNVPVAYCEKKFVKKKKGFKSGTVTMEREKVIFVKPVLPNGDN